MLSGEEFMRVYVCSLPNVKGPGRFPELITEDPNAVATFVQKWDIPGRAVYACTNPLKPGATRRAVETVAEIVKIHVDIDFKDLVAGPDEIDVKLQHLPLEPTAVRDSGGGRHVEYILKEPISSDDAASFAHATEVLKRLTAALSGDPAPAHPAALLRVEGSHNSKREGDPVLVRTLWGSSNPVDLSELEALVDLLPPEGIFARKESGNGRAHDPGTSEHRGPIDVDSRLEDMSVGGPGLSGVHVTHRDCTSSLLSRGVSVEEALREVLADSRKRLAPEKVAGWDWRKEEHDLYEMSYSWVAKHPELSPTLPDHLRAAFETKLAEGKNPVFTFRRDLGWYVRSRTGSQDTNTGKQETPKPAAHVIQAKPFVRFNPADLPPREWLYGGHYQRGIVTATVGPGGGGKSSLDLVEMMAICTGRPLLGEQPLVRERAWYHNAEDPGAEIYRRIAAVCQHYEIDQDELDGWLFVTSGIEMPIRITTSRLGRASIDASVAAAIIRTITENEIGVTSFDPLIAHHRNAENVSEEMDDVIREFARIANVTDCAVEVVHHTRKPAPGQEELSVMDSRGAVAIINAVRSARVLNTMSRAEADKHRIDDVDRRLHFRVDNGKANMAPPTAARWYKFASIALPNADNVGVVTMWEQATPGGTDLAEAERADEDLFMELLRQFILSNRSVGDGPGASYAPFLFAKEPRAKQARVSKERFADAMRRLFHQQKIRIETEGSYGRKRKRIVPT
jgi:hypothetical protein